MANVLIAHDGPRVAAIVDWELSTIGDPLIDLGWLLTHWPDEDGGGGATTGTQPWEGFPSKSDLITHYAALSARPVDDITWRAVLACFKRAAIIEGSYARACAGRADMSTGERLHANAVALIAKAETWTRKPI